LCLRLDEGASIVAHGLVSGIRVFGEESESRRDKNHQEKDESERGVVNKEDDTHDTAYDTGLIEHIAEDKDEDGAEEVDSRNSNIEAVSLLVHIWPKHADGDEEGGFNQDQRNCLCRSASLSNSNKHSLDENVDQERHNKVVSSGLELHVEESPFVECSGIRVKDVRWVLVHRD